MISAKVNFVSIPRTGTNSIYQLFGGIDGNDNHKSIRLTKDDRFSFAVIRHPLQRLMSWWRYHSNAIYDPKGEIYKGSFKDWAMAGFPHHWTDEHCVDRGITSPLNQHEFVTDKNGQIAVDRLINYDYLQEQFAMALSPYMSNTSLPHINKSNRQLVASSNSTILLKSMSQFKSDWHIYKSLNPR